MIQKETDLTRSFDRIADTYDNETETFHHKITDYITLNNLLEVLPDNRNLRILDSGGGTGKFSLYLVKLGYNVDLIDISERSVAMAKEKAAKAGLTISTFVGNSETTPFENDIYDFVMMNGGVISYTPDPQALLVEAYRILKPGGMLFFDFLNSLGWALESFEKDYRPELALTPEKLIQMPDWDYPVRVFSRDRMKSYLNKNGFVIRSEFGLVLLSNSLPLDIRYSKNYDSALLEKYKKIELELSRRADCLGSSWGCAVCAIKDASR